MTDKKMEISILVNDEELHQTLLSQDFHNTHTDFSEIKLEDERDIFICSDSNSLSAIAQFARKANSERVLRAVFVEETRFPNWSAKILEHAQLSNLKNTIFHSGMVVPLRVLRAWKEGLQDRFIADAAVIGEELWITDCSMNNYKLRFDSMTQLKNIPVRNRDNFTISKEGSRISWDDFDVDLNLESIKNHLDPSKAKFEKIVHDYRYGHAIKKLREKVGIKQSQIAGLDERTVRRIEQGGPATLSSLEKLAVAHSMDLKCYLKELAEFSDPHSDCRPCVIGRATVGQRDKSVVQAEDLILDHQALMPEKHDVAAF